MNDKYNIPGAKCTVNSAGDLMMDKSDGFFIDKLCFIVKRTKSGLIEVRLWEDPTQRRSFPQKNITLLED